MLSNLKHTFAYLLVVIVFVSCNAASDVNEIFVSPKGDDSASGSEDAPVATLHKAAELARGKTGKEPFTIWLSGGVYRIDKPLALGIEDGGTESYSVSWKAIPGEIPVISGGIEVKGWKDEGNGIWSAILPSDLSEIPREMFVNNKRAVRARFPNEGYMRIKKAGEDNRTNFFFNKNDFPKVEDIKSLEIVLLHDWSISRIGVKSIDWNKNHLIAVDTIGYRGLDFFKLTGWEKQPRYFLENAYEFLDAPGEWFCNKEERKIYYKPVEGEKINEVEVIVPLSPKLVTITGDYDTRTYVKNISFEGITFEHASWLIPERGYCGIQATHFDNRYDDGKNWAVVPAAIELDLAENCTFNNCVIRHTGGSGVWFREECQNCEINGCKLYDISGNGLNIGEGRDRKYNGKPWWQNYGDQAAEGNKLTNSLVEKCGKQFYGAVGVWGGLVANTTISKNEIRNLPYTGVSIGWMWNPTPTPCRGNTIESNHIHHVMNKLSDGGGIYNLGLQPGSRIANNLIHDVKINAGRAESNGMFLDEGITDVVVEKNIVYNIAKSPLRFHKATTNIVRNNVFVCADNTPPIRYNNTKEEDITKIDNLILQQSSEKDMKKLESLVEEWKKLNYQ